MEPAPSPPTKTPPIATERAPEDVLLVGASRVGSWPRAAMAVAVVTAVAAAVSRWGPRSSSGTLIGALFLVAVWLIVLRRDEVEAREYGLSLGGLLDREPLHLPTMVAATGRALGWALLMALVFFPPFVLGYHWLWSPWARHPFHLHLSSRLVNEAAAQVLAVALPEEAFYRGVVQTELRSSSPFSSSNRGQLLWAIPVTSFLFALGHVATEPNLGRLAVFFPSLVFGVLRARTGGIGAGVLFHALCNLLVYVLADGYGLIPLVK